MMSLMALLVKTYKELCNNQHTTCMYVCILYIYTFIGINNHPKRMFFIMCPTKKGNTNIK